VEAGLRSFDRTMPEEINRVLTDHLADLLFTTEPSGNENLRNEGIPEDKIHFVGNTMIDTLVRLLPKAEARWPGLQTQFGLERYVLVTLHRPSNVDDPATLDEIMVALSEISRQTRVVFPVHPRTRQRIAGLGIAFDCDNLTLTEPLGYLDFLALEAHASLVLTDSGGVQEETTYLGVPCLTVRPNTERPVTVTVGTNRLVRSQVSALVSESVEALKNQLSSQSKPELWDGMASRRVVASIQQAE
jgi:UDP-N-acetylglucosamine 2-epimerase (non-hydrolysing)